MNLYSELLDLLSREEPTAPAGYLGRVASLVPLTLELDGRLLCEGIYPARGLQLTEADLGETVALLPVNGGLVVLCRV